MSHHPAIAVTFVTAYPGPFQDECTRILTRTLRLNDPDGHLEGLRKQIQEAQRKKNGAYSRVCGATWRKRQFWGFMASRYESKELRLLRRFRRNLLKTLQGDVSSLRLGLAPGSTADESQFMYELEPYIRDIRRDFERADLMWFQDPLPA